MKMPSRRNPLATGTDTARVPAPNDEADTSHALLELGQVGFLGVMGKPASRFEHKKAKLGTFFSVGMIAFAGAAILYDTSHVLRSFPEDRYVAASLQLVASVALMFWYVLRLMMSLQSRD